MSLRDGVGWKQIGSVSEVEPPASFSSDGPFGRQVFMFGWLNEEVGVWEVEEGFEATNPLARQLAIVRKRKLSDLSEPCVVEVFKHGARIPTQLSLIE